MAEKKHHEAADTGFENVENALSRTEKYIEDNQKSLVIIVAAIVIIVGGYIGYRRFLVTPKEKEAQSQMFVAQQYFQQDSFNLALNGDGNNPGFLEIIDEYGITQSANLSQYYAGISYLRTGKFEEAIDHLKQFDSNDEMVAPIALGAIGDAYSELGNFEDALDFYVKASGYNDNEFTTPIYLMKAGLLYEETGKFEKAIDTYQKIKNQYANTTEGRQIDKFIARAQVKAGKL